MFVGIIPAHLIFGGMHKNTFLSIKAFMERKGQKANNSFSAYN